jgi:hypothetical protein
LPGCERERTTRSRALGERVNNECVFPSRERAHSSMKRKRGSRLRPQAPPVATYIGPPGDNSIPGLHRHYMNSSLASACSVRDSSRAKCEANCHSSSNREPKQGAGTGWTTCQSRSDVMQPWSLLPVREPGAALLAQGRGVTTTLPSLTPALVNLVPSEGGRE